MSAVFLHQLRRTRRAWGSSLAAGLASPTLFLFAIGAGLGSQIDDAELALLGVNSYLDYIGPGVLVVTAMQVAATESLWPTMGLLRWGGIYKAILATPITSAELGVAHVMWLGFRAPLRERSEAGLVSSYRSWRCSSHGHMLRRSSR